MPPTWLRGFLLTLVSLLSFPQQLHAKAVFAHFMIANAQNYTRSDWHSDILLAQASSIDAFALNAGSNQRHLRTAFDNAFTVAEDLNFKLFFSLDYSGAGHWAKDQVVTLLKNYTTREAYFRHDGGENGEGRGKALVSTFEGFQAAGDWDDIKKEVAKSVGASNCCVFIPDWTSVGPRKAAAVSSIDGLMSWDAWPDGTKEMNTTEDESYMEILGEKAYIMPVSPWFYTNLRQFDKNWVWKGDDLWYTRWQQVIELQPEYVEILTWNDYGESHYIGPLRENAVGILGDAGAPFDYVAGMQHDGWRALLPYLIKKYKAGIRGEIDEEVLSVWYRLTPANACGSGKTTGNTESQHQTLLPPGGVLQDKVFYSALLDGRADVSVSIGEVNRSAGWTDVPDGGKGVYHGSVAFGGRTGEVVVTLSREGDFLAEMKGRSIEDDCLGNLTNWNAWVGNVTAAKGGRGGSGGSDSGEESAALPLSTQMALVFGLGLGLMTSLLI